MIKILAVLLLLIGVFIYLNRSYAAFYDPIKKYNLQSPFTEKEVLIYHGSENLKYIALGDSLTAGVGSEDYKKTYPYILAENMAQSVSKSINLIVLAKSGDKISDLSNSQVSQVLLTKPDIITILIGINDIHDFIPEEVFAKKLSDIVVELKSNTSAQIYLITIPYLGSSESLIFPYNLIFDYQTKKLNLIIQKVASQNELKVIDLYSQQKDTFNQISGVYSLDKFHPSEKGYQLWGKTINADFNK